MPKILKTNQPLYFTCCVWNYKDVCLIVTFNKTKQKKLWLKLSKKWSIIKSLRTFNQIDQNQNCKVFPKQKSNSFRVVKHSKLKTTQVTKTNLLIIVKISFFSFKIKIMKNFFNRKKQKVKSNIQNLHLISEYRKAKIQSQTQKEIQNKSLRDFLLLKYL